jgi:hypothetical protein
MAVTYVDLLIEIVRGDILQTYRTAPEGTKWARENFEDGSIHPVARSKMGFS